MNIVDIPDEDWHEIDGGNAVAVLKNEKSGLFHGFLFQPHPNPSGNVQWKVVSHTKTGVENKYRALELAKRMVMQ